MSALSRLLSIRFFLSNSYTQRGLAPYTQGKQCQNNSAPLDTKTQKNDKKNFEGTGIRRDRRYIIPASLSISTLPKKHNPIVWRKILLARSERAEKLSPCLSS